MTLPAASVQLPLLAASWMNELFDGPIPDESRATCSDCVMCRSTGEHGGRRFRPDTKCCTFIPRLPNYTVGGILHDTSPETDFGRATVEARISSKVGVTPLGVDAPPTFKVLYSHGRDAFGGNRALRCPHYIEQGGLCGIWRYRNAICSTWYCQVVRGTVSRAFWHNLLGLLGEVESALALWCAEQLDVGSAPLAHLLRTMDQKDERLTAADMDNQSDPASYRTAWGDRWIDREHEYYLAAWQLVSPLSWPDVLTIAGPRVRAMARLSRDAYADLVSEVIPDRLRRGSFSVTVTRHEYVLLQGAGSLDSLAVLTGVVDILPLFDGQRPTSEAMTLAKHAGTRLSNWAVRQLVDFKILVPAP
jgi:hypothetical protein